MLKLTWISQCSAVQRKGRAGRTGPGVCLKLYSSARAASFCQRSVPEMLRTPLTELCLATKLLAPVNTSIAEFMATAPEPPSFAATRSAIQNLKVMEALDEWEDVTELGNHLLDLPIEPRLGKMVLYAVVLKCLDPILTITCCASYKDPFELNANGDGKRDFKLLLKSLAEGSKSDHMTLLRAFQGWQKAKSEGREKSFCHRHQVSSSTLEMVTGMRTQLLGQLRASGFVRAKGPGDIRELNRNSENWAVVKAALVAGAYPSLARYDRVKRVLQTKKENKVKLFQRSVVLDDIKAQTGSLDGLPTDWLIYDELTKAGRLTMIKGVTAISPITVALFAGRNRLPETDTFKGNTYLAETSDSDEEEKLHRCTESLLKLDDWTVFRSDPSIVQAVLKLRFKFSSILLRRLNTCGKTHPDDDNIVQTVVNVLSVEEDALNIEQPRGIGQRPKFNGGTNRRKNKVSPMGPHHPLVEQQSNYFIIKATSSRAIDISLATGLWQFGNQTERKLAKALKTGFKPYVIFSVQGSGHFQGYARFTGHLSSERVPELQAQSQNSGSGIQYWIEWIKRADIPFHMTKHLLNTFNENKKGSSFEGWPRSGAFRGPFAVPVVGCLSQLILGQEPQQ